MEGKRANEIQMEIVTGHTKTIMYSNRKTSPFIDTLTFVRLRWKIVYPIVTTIDRSEMIFYKERRKSINQIFKGRRSKRSPFPIFLKFNGIKNDRLSGIGLGTGSERAAKKKNVASGRRKNVGPDTQQQSRYGAQSGLSLCGFSGRLRRRRLVLLLLLLLPHEPALLQQPVDHDPIGGHHVAPRSARTVFVQHRLANAQRL